MEPVEILHVQVAGDTPPAQLEQIGQLFHQALAEHGTVATHDSVSARLLKTAGPVDGVVLQPTLTVEYIAQVCHNVNRAYCQAIDDAVPDHWVDATPEIRNSALQGVLFALRYDATPEQQHDAWMQQKIADGWVYGPVKNAETKEHPCLVPYADLPQTQRVKDFLFRSVVHTLRWKLPVPDLDNVLDVEKIIDTGHEKVSLLALHLGDVFLLDGRRYTVTSAPYVNYTKPIPVWAVDVQLVIDAPDASPFPFPKAADFASADQMTDAP